MDDRPFRELGESGLLWLINTTVFHPRGWALAIHVDDDGHATGWSLQGDGREVWDFTPEGLDVLFAAAQETLRPHGDANEGGDTDG